MKGTIGTGQRAETRRLFYAVRVAPDLIAPLKEVQQKLRGDWRLVVPEQFHLTLVFMPFVLPSEMVQAEKSGETVASTMKPFAVSLGKTGCFPGWQNPRVFILHAVAHELSVLSGEIKKELGEIQHDQKPFRGHLTLARAKSPSVRPLDLTLDLSWKVDQLELIESILTGRGAQHTLFRAFPLRG